MSHRSLVCSLLLSSLAAISTSACSHSDESAKNPGEAKTISAKLMADSLHSVISADRAVYTKLIVNRLQNEEHLIKASEHWKEDKTLLLPAQMLRSGAELVTESGAAFSYSLQSQWPINPQNAPRTAAEKAGLKYVAEHKAENYYAEETLGEKRYFTAVYADSAVAPACVSCHNQHADTPKTDFKLGDVMGGIVIRIPI